MFRFYNIYIFVCLSVTGLSFASDLSQLRKDVLAKPHSDILTEVLVKAMFKRGYRGTNKGQKVYACGEQGKSGHPCMFRQLYLPKTSFVKHLMECHL